MSRMFSLIRSPWPHRITFTRKTGDSSGPELLFQWVFALSLPSFTTLINPTVNVVQLLGLISPLSPFFSQHHQPHLESVKAKNLMRKEIRKIRVRLDYSIGRMFPWAVSSRSPLILGKLVAACEFFQGKGRPDSTLLFTLIGSRWFSFTST